MSELKRQPLADKGAWAPFMCPACRGIFRVQSGREGRATCPLCDSEISIVLEKATPTPTTSASEEEQPLVRRKRRRKHTSDKQSWDSDTEKKQSKNSSQGIVLTSFFLLSILAAIGGFFVITNQKSRNQQPSNTGSIENPSNSFKPLKGIDSNGTQRDPFTLPEGENLVEVLPSDQRTAQEFAKKFLACENMEDLAPLIREPERVMPLIRKFYEKEPYKAIGALEVDDSQISQVMKRFTSFVVVLKDYSSRPIALELTDDGPRVDWESWVSHCETPWETFIEEQIKEPQTVRVTVEKVFYYNFNFRDDSQWACFRLTRSPDETVIFGYVPQDSPFLKELPLNEEDRDVFRLKIAYPSNPVSNNQVIITDFVGEGWVDGL